MVVPLLSLLLRIALSTGMVLGPQSSYTVSIGNTEEVYVEVTVPDLTKAIAFYDLEENLLSS